MVYDPLKPDQEVNERRSALDRLVLGFLVVALVCCFVVAFTISSGCVTAAKQIVSPTPTPTPEPTQTPEPTPTLTPTPEPTPDWTGCSWQDQCFKLRDWHHWWRKNASGYQDLITHATVYNYKILPHYHYQSISWGTNAKRKESPNPGYQYLFVFLNVYSDGPARQFGYLPHKFLLSVRDILYYPITIYNPEERIIELDDMWDYAHVDSPIPYSYKIVQEKGSGIITAEQLSVIMPGRSNAWDGYIIFEIPIGTNLQEVRLAASFDNLGGSAFWKLV